MVEILQKICRRRRLDLEQSGAEFPFSRQLPERQNDGSRTAGETLAYLREEFTLIGECKKGSPSAGILVDDYHPADLALSYQRAGARAISVLTEGPHFHGSLDHMKEVVGTVDIPVLRKDFIIHPLQLDQAAAGGAKMVLLIAACLSDEDLAFLGDYARRLGLLTLTEVHTREERDRVLKLDLPLLGINNRDLKSFKVDLQVSLTLMEEIPRGVTVISESGIRTSEDINILKEQGFAGALVGTSIVSSVNPGGKIAELLGKQS